MFKSFVEKQCVSILDQASFEKLLQLARKGIFHLDETFYKQLHGVAIGSPLGPTPANSLLWRHEKRWLDNAQRNSNHSVFQAICG